MRITLNDIVSFRRQEGYRSLEIERRIKSGGSLLIFRHAKYHPLVITECNCTYDGPYTVQIGAVVINTW